MLVWQLPECLEHHAQLTEVIDSQGSFAGSNTADRQLFAQGDQCGLQAPEMCMKLAGSRSKPPVLGAPSDKSTPELYLLRVSRELALIDQRSISQGLLNVITRDAERTHSGERAAKFSIWGSRVLSPRHANHTMAPPDDRAQSYVREVTDLVSPRRGEPVFELMRLIEDQVSTDEPGQVRRPTLVLSDDVTPATNKRMVGDDDSGILCKPGRASHHRAGRCPFTLVSRASARGGRETQPC